jgi:hypothetical protein
MIAAALRTRLTVAGGERRSPLLRKEGKMDQELEKAIDEVGREKVFQRARNIGWTDDVPPAWVWWGIVNELRIVAPKRS